MDGFNRVKQCRHGLFVYNINDAYVGRSLDQYGEFSQKEADLFQQLIRPSDLVVEVGSNIGAHTVVLAKLVGPQGLVIAYEPQRVLYQTLCANVALNSITWVFAYPQAVGREPGAIIIPALDHTRPNNFGGINLQGHTQGERVTMVTLDSLTLSKCRLIKIDVEGMEIDVLQGAKQTIAKHRPYLYVENDRQEKSQDLIRYIDSLNYNMYWHRPPLFNNDNYLKNPENVFGNIVSINMLCMPKGSGPPIMGFQSVAVPGKA
ncbi:MAG TPA: FkbM family methyltransferase [Isosphaeraceae bacterium]|jgi:FkbM family methyltransferase|nr:FkbM family methyltransferase [Isosphaeraceae bacterium]